MHVYNEAKQPLPKKYVYMKLQAYFNLSMTLSYLK